MIVRENIILALGQLILDWESGLPTGSGHGSRGLTTSHIWDCQKLPQKSPPRGPVGIAGEERAVQSGAAAGAPPGWGPLTLPAGQGGAPGPRLPPSSLPEPSLPSRVSSKDSRRRARAAFTGGKSKAAELAAAGLGALSQSGLLFPEHPQRPGSPRSCPSRATARVTTMRCPRRGLTRSAAPLLLPELPGPHQSSPRSHLVLCSGKLNSRSKAWA